MPEDDRLNRRRVLKTIGGSAIAGAAFTQGAAAQDLSEIEKSGENYSQVEDERKIDELRNEMTKSNSYRELKDHIKEYYDGVKVDLSSTTVIEVSESSNGTKEAEILGYVVEIPVNGLENGGIIGTIENNTLKSVSASEHYVSDDGEMTVDTFKEQNGGIIEKSENYDIEEAIESHRNRVSPAGLLPSKCSVCKSLYSAANSVGCGVAAATLCAAAGLSTGGAAITVCTPMVPAFCSVYSDIQNHHGVTPYAVCSGELAESDLPFCD